MKRLLLVALALVIVGGGLVAWRVLDARAERLAAEGSRSGSADVIFPGDYTPSESEQAWIDGHAAEAGAWVRKFDGWRMVLVTMGEKPTGGYAVEVVTAARSAGGWVIDVRFVSPKPGDVVTQVLTYPYGFVKVPDDGLAVVVRDVTGDQPVELKVVGE
ncbi:MAG: protease complex subunit PrcB family protein [Firmicutes bacterium]|nr:protease complex subunit PrcB family protein [Bacillota bacterium]